MAKNKNRERKQSQSERGQREAQAASLETQAEQPATPMTTSDMARKGRQKRFGHN
jgi:hypothetical protein